jgi:hypothetical protein
MGRGRVVLLVEPKGDTRLVYADLIRNRADCEVTDAASPERVDEESLRPKAIDLLVTHVHFYKENGDRDYERAATFCKEARLKVRGDLPIIGLSSIDFGTEQKERYGFPDDLESFHIDYDRSNRLVELVRNILDGSKNTKNPRSESEKEPGSKCCRLGQRLHGRP